MNLFGIAIFLCFHLAKATASEEQDPYMFDVSNFKDLTSSSPHFVMFFAPWCGHCRALQPAWDQLTEHYNEKQTGTVKIAKVDCTLQSKLCSENGVTGYPTLKLFIPGKDAVRHRGSRDLQGLKNFVVQSLQEGDDASGSDTVKTDVVEGLHDLTSDNFGGHVAHGHHFIMFYAPWCGHCKRLEPTWRQLATELKDQSLVKIGRVDCTANNKVCESMKVRGYPTLLWFNNGEKLEQYQGGRSIENLLAMVTKMTGQQHELTKDEKKEIVDLPVANEVEASEEHLVRDGLYELTDSNFKSSISEGDIFVNFFAPWCGMCKRMEPAWKELAKFYEDNNDVKIARVDCTKHQSVCKAQGIRGYPTLKFFRNGNEAEGGPSGRDISNLKAYVQSKLEDRQVDAEDEQGAKELTDETFADVIALGITFVKFYAPWCGHCKRLAPTWDELAGEDFSDVPIPVVIAKLDCTKFHDICTSNSVRGYPSLKLFIDGESVASYPGNKPRKLDSFKEFVLEMSKGFLSDDQPRDEL